MIDMMKLTYHESSPIARVISEHLLVGQWQPNYRLLAYKRNGCMDINHNTGYTRLPSSWDMA